MIEANIRGKGDEAGGKSLGGGKQQRQKHKCKNCNKEGYHEDDDCFTLAKNKDKCPACYKEYDGMGSGGAVM